MDVVDVWSYDVPSLTPCSKRVIATGVRALAPRSRSKAMPPVVLPEPWNALRLARRWRQIVVDCVRGDENLPMDINSTTFLVVMLDAIGKGILFTGSIV